MKSGTYRRKFITLIALSAIVCALVFIGSAGAEYDPLGHTWQMTETGMTGMTGISGIWTRQGDGNEWKAVWANGAIADLNITGGGDSVTVTRKDPAGISTGLTATYTGEFDKSDGSVSGKVEWTFADGNTVSGTWVATFDGAAKRAKSAKGPSPTADDLKRDLLKDVPGEDGSEPEPSPAEKRDDAMAGYDLIDSILGEDAMKVIIEYAFSGPHDALERDASQAGKEAEHAFDIVSGGARPAAALLGHAVRLASMTNLDGTPLFPSLTRMMPAMLQMAVNGIEDPSALIALDRFMALLIRMDVKAGAGADLL